MTRPLDNPPAFPLVVGTPSDPWGMQNDGMTLRDYFAAVALQGCLANEDFRKTAGNNPAVTSAFAYETADAMLEARVTKGESK